MSDGASAPVQTPSSEVSDGDESKKPVPANDPKAKEAGGDDQADAKPVDAKPADEAISTD